MRQMILICLIFLTVTQLHAQTDTDTSHVPPQVMQLGRGTAEALGWHSDGHVLAVGGSLGIWLYDENLADLAHFPDTGSVAWLAWSPDGNRLATANWDDIVMMWDVTLDPYALTLSRSWTFHDVSYILRFFWSPDSERLAVITSDGAQVLDVNTGETLLTIPDLEFAFAWHPDGTQIAGMVDLGEDVGKQVRVWDAATGAIINTYTSTDPYLFWSNIQWSPDGSVLVGVTSIPATIHVWNVETGDLMNDPDAFVADMSAYFDMWWLDDGQQLVTVSRYVSPPATSILDVWDTESWTTLDRGASWGETRNIAKHPTQAVWAGLTWGSQIMIWSLEEVEPLQVLSVHSQPPSILAWSFDNQHLAAATRTSGSLNIWDMTLLDQPQSQVITVPYPRWDIVELRWSPDGDKLLGFQSAPQITAPGAFPIGFIVEWDTQTGEFLRTIHETPGYVAHDGSGDYLPDYTWNDDFSRVVTQMSGHPVTISTTTNENGFLSPDEELTAIDIVDYPLEIAWSPNNTMLAVIIRDSQGETSAWVYDAETGDLLNRLTPSFYAVLYDLSWSPDSSMVALVGRRGIAGSGEMEYRLDILEVDPSSDEAAYITTILDADTTFYHAWNPGSRAIAVSTSLGVAIYPVESTVMGVEPAPITTIPDVRVVALAWSSDGKWLAGSSEDGTVRIWDVTSINK